MGALRLLVQLLEILRAARIDEFFRLQKLAVSKDGGERIIQLVSYARDELAHGGHFLALQELLLSETKRVIGLAGLFEQTRLLYGGGDLIRGSGEQIEFGGGKFPQATRAHEENANDAIIRPQDDHLGGLETLIVPEIAKQFGQRGSGTGKDRGMNLPHLFEE